jgi:type I site-specific restriction endonuclease
VAGARGIVRLLCWSRVSDWQVEEFEVPLNESDTTANLIDPAILSCGWIEDDMRREVLITARQLFLVGDEVQRKPPLRADYVLRQSGVPVAVLEAKDESHHEGAGLQQAKAYADCWKSTSRFPRMERHSSNSTI